ncbi:PEP/pyruvate-binding domain-containing protein [Sphaerotilaceae bacterium SBD11-9]
MKNPHLLSDYRRMSLATVGAKFAHQATLRGLGLPVPDFFCLGAGLFAELVQPERARLQALLATVNLQDRHSIATGAQAMQAIVRGLRIDAATGSAIERLFDRQLPGARWVSVRACMVAARAEHSEDSVANPFAGISETHLYVPRSEVLARVLDCWASAYSEKALTYRLSQGMDALDVSVAVGVQRMVFGERSFVMFTCNPNTAARDTLLVAGHGIGEGVVQEAVPVDHYFVNAKTRAIERVITAKTRALGFDEARGHGLCEREVDAARAEAACLSDTEILALRDMGQRIEQAFGWPQDVEGTFDAEGRIHILQARPVSIDFTTKRVWTGLNVTESYPGVSSPLTYSLARLFYRVIFRDIYRRAGASDRLLADHHHRLDRMIGYVNGRINYSLNAFYLLHGLVPIFPWLARAWENMIGLKTSFFMHAGEPPPAQGAWSKRWQVLRAMGTFGVEFVMLPRRMRHYKLWWRERAAQSRAVLAGRPDALALTEEFHRLWRDVGRQWGVTLVNDAYIFTLHALVESLFKRWRLADDPSLLSNLLCGDDKVESVEVFLSVLRIAEHIRARPALADEFLASDEATLVRRVRERSLEPQLGALIDTHIALYGDRSMEELKMENPSLREDPSVLLRGIRRFVRSGLDAEACRRAELGKRAEAEAALSARLGRFSLRRPLLRWMLKLLREVIAHRENSRYCRSELFGICRDIFHAQAEHLIARGAIAQRSDVCCLTVDEILGFTDGTGVDESFHASVARRRAELAVYAASEVPEILVTDGALRSNALQRAPFDPARAARQLSGLGSSMGVARGTARVVRDPHAVDELPADTILVARETDPGWLFLMLASKGIVVERGSMLSHTAITGRKFGIPTVVGVDDACSRIPDGAAMEIDGGRGTVELLH